MNTPAALLLGLLRLLPPDLSRHGVTGSGKRLPQCVNTAVLGRRGRDYASASCPAYLTGDYGWQKVYVEMA